MTDFKEQLHDLVTANRILAREEVVDAFGHVSIRHPEHADRYILSQSRAPELVDLADLMEYTLEGEPLDQDERPLYSERPIHGGAYEARPDVMAVVHNHSPAVVPFGVTGVPLRPMFHMGAVVGEVVPVWDIRDNFNNTSLLVTTMEQGRDLAATLGPASPTGGAAALMRGHGCMVVGSTLKQAVMRSVYLQANARLLLASLSLSTGRGGEVNYLSASEIELMAESLSRPSSIARAWEYWATRAGREA